MAYCGGSTIQIYYSPHSLSAKKACTNLQTSRASENNYLSGKVRVKTWPRNVSEGKGEEETLLREKSLLRNLCQRGNGSLWQNDEFHLFQNGPNFVMEPEVGAHVSSPGEHPPHSTKPG
ncbi:hypothetical protein Q9966_003990 [Columba livia]|nr:hypothetical protein Q9966_003990 [Columba livia]